MSTPTPGAARPNPHLRFVSVETRANDRSMQRRYDTSRNPQEPNLVIARVAIGGNFEPVEQQIADSGIGFTRYRCRVFCALPPRDRNIIQQRAEVPHRPPTKWLIDQTYKGRDKATAGQPLSTPLWGLEIMPRSKKPWMVVANLGEPALHEVEATRLKAAEVAGDPNVIEHLPQLSARLFLGHISKPAGLRNKPPDEYVDEYETTVRGLSERAGLQELATQIGDVTLGPLIHGLLVDIRSDSKPN